MLLGDTHIYTVPGVTRILPQKGRKKREALCTACIPQRDRCNYEMNVLSRRKNYEKFMFVVVTVGSDHKSR